MKKLRREKSTCCEPLHRGKSRFGWRFLVYNLYSIWMMEVPKSQHTISYENLVKNSNAFNDSIIKFPTRDNLIKELKINDPSYPNKISQFAAETRILIHSSVIPFIEKFLELKRIHGSKKEKDLYAKMSWEVCIKLICFEAWLIIFISNLFLA